MNTVNKKAESYSDFWLDNKDLTQYVPDGDFGKDFSTDLIQLAAYRRIVSNFVFILTRKNIPVQFKTESKSSKSFTDGKTIYLSASIRNKPDFDWTVGVTLHEAAHILLTDFKAMEASFSPVPLPLPTDLKKKVKEKGLSEEQTFTLCHWVWNYIEDRFIDTYVFNEAPGYRGYYKAMYDKFWNSERISKYLKSRHYRNPSLKSYNFRVINLTNPETDLDALVGLREIAELIDISNVTRLDSTDKRIDLAYEVVKIIVDNLPEQPKPDSKDLANATIKEISKKLSDNGNPQPKKDNDAKDNDKGEGKDGNEEGMTEDEKKEINVILKKQREFLNHSYEDAIEKISDNKDAILDVIEKSGIVVMPSGFGLKGESTKSSVDVVVVKKMTKFLIDSGKAVFPLTAKGYGSVYAPPKNEEAVEKGFVLGKLLGKRLQVRGEENVIKYIRKTSGRIERRLLADIGAGLEGIFSKTKIERYNKLKLHISVDASGSMAIDKKWLPTLTCVTAICVAASMVRNLNISVSFRSTINLNNGGNLPYVVLAYDSAVDKISKVRSLFPYLTANGATPEGLAFEAIADEFIVGKQMAGQDTYFLNMSDGEPAYMFTSRNGQHNNFLYAGEMAAQHTRIQINKIKAKGVKVLSYFIKGDDYSSLMTTMNTKQYTLKQLFHIMYGENAQFIDVQNVIDIAKTMNKLFLTRDITM